MTNDVPHTESDATGNKREWFYKLKDQKSGPFSLDDVVLLLRAGDIPLTVELWKPGMDGWVLAVELPDIMASVPPPGESTAIEHQPDDPDKEDVNMPPGASPPFPDPGPRSELDNTESEQTSKSGLKGFLGPLNSRWFLLAGAMAFLNANLWVGVARASLALKRADAEPRSLAVELGSIMGSASGTLAIGTVLSVVVTAWTKEPRRWIARGSLVFTVVVILLQWVGRY